MVTRPHPTISSRPWWKELTKCSPKYKTKGLCSPQHTPSHPRRAEDLPRVTTFPHRSLSSTSNVLDHLCLSVWTRGSLIIINLNVYFKTWFIFGCAGSSLLHGLTLVAASVGYSPVMIRGLLTVSDFSCQAQAPGLQGSRAQYLGRTGLVAPWHVEILAPGPGIEPVCPARQGSFLTTGSARNPRDILHTTLYAILFHSSFGHRKVQAGFCIPHGHRVFSLSLSVCVCVCVCV